MRSRSVVLTGWLLVSAALTMFGLLSPIANTNDFALELAMGIFGGFIAAITFALALTIQQEQAWPSARAVVADSGALVWLVISLASIVLAVGNELLGLQASGRLATASVWMSMLGLVAGVLNVGAVLSAAGGSGRRKSRIRILRKNLAAAARSSRGISNRSTGRSDTLDDFIVSFRRAVESDNLASIRSHSEEIVEASERLGAREQYSIVTTQLRMATILGSELLRGDTPLAATAAFQDLLNGVVDYAGRTLESRGRTMPSHGLLERRAVLILGETTRVAAFFGKAVWQKYNEGLSAGNPAVDADYASGLILTCHEVRHRIRFAVDPDPPEKFLKAEDPWRQGVSDPETILLWLWAFTYFDGTDQGSALYSVYEVLLGKKYFGTVFGETSVLTDLRREFILNASAHAREVLTRHGGFDRIFLEICANSIAQIKSYEWVAPNQLTSNGYFDRNPRARLRQFVSLASTEAERPRDVDVAIADLIFLLGPSAKKFSVFAAGEYSARDLGTFGSASVADRTAAAVLACALTLMSSTREREARQRRRLEEFFSRLPDALQKETERFVRRVMPSSGAESELNGSAYMIDRLSIVWGK
jgi:hypothetical protein